jgi:O-acetyl-ADP-ribose deacetylase (regulator of RNase III)
LEPAPAGAGGKLVAKPTGYTSAVESEILARRTADGVRWCAVLGDLTLEPVDAIVNAANTRLQHGGGLAGAIAARGGPEIQEASQRLAPVAVGDAVVTTAGRLPCRWVIHAVGPCWGDGDEERKLRSAVAASLDCATEIGARSLALPAISTGIFGYPKAEGTATIVDEAVVWLRSHRQSPLQRLRFTAFDRETADLFACGLERILHGRS